MGLIAISQYRRRCAEALITGSFDACPYCRMRNICESRIGFLQPLFRSESSRNREFRALLSGMSTRIGFNGLLQVLAAENDSARNTVPELLVATLMHMIGASLALTDIDKPDMPWMSWLLNMDGVTLAKVEQESLECLAALKSEVESRWDSFK